jgi:hypothetical protein
MIFIWVSCQFDYYWIFVLNFKRLITRNHSSLSPISSEKHEFLCFWRKSTILINQREREREKWWAKSFSLSIYLSKREKFFAHVKTISLQYTSKMKKLNYRLLKLKSSNLSIYLSQREKFFAHVETISLQYTSKMKKLNYRLLKLKSSKLSIYLSQREKFFAHVEWLQSMSIERMINYRSLAIHRSVELMKKISSRTWNDCNRCRNWKKWSTALQKEIFN